MVIKTDTGKEYIIYYTDMEKFDEKAFEKNIQKGNQLVLYVSDDKWISGVEDENNVYLDVNNFVYEKVPIVDIVILCVFGFILIFLIVFLIAYKQGYVESMY